LDWTVDGPSAAALSVVVILHADGTFVAQYPTAANTFTLPTGLSSGDYQWFVVTGNSSCGATVSVPALFKNSGRVVP
jgi:hypothetical protein